MKIQKLPFKKRPKSSGKPVSTEELKGGCWYFVVTWIPGIGLSVDRPFAIHGKPFRGVPFPGMWKIRIKKRTTDLCGWRSLGELGIIPYQNKFPTRTFHHTMKAWSFYKDIVDRQDLAAYKEALNAM